MARFNHWQWQCPEKKNVDKKKLASKATEENNAEYYLCSCGPPASTVKTFGYSNANKGRPSCLEMETKILIRYQEKIYQGRCTSQIRELQLKVRLIFGYVTPTSDMGDVPAMGTPNINLQFDDRMRFSDI